MLLRSDAGAGHRISHCVLQRTVAEAHRRENRLTPGGSADCGSSGKEGRSMRHIATYSMFMLLACAYATLDRLPPLRGSAVVLPEILERVEPCAASLLSSSKSLMAGGSRVQG